MSKSYYINFDTTTFAGKILTVKVTLETEVLADMSVPIYVDLLSDPHYLKLQEYVLNNPKYNYREAQNS